MKKFKRFCYRILPVALCAAMLGGCGASAASSSAAESTVSTDSAPLKVMASFYPMYDFAQKIGGDKVTVTNMVPAGTEPHDWEPSTTDITNLEDADVFIYSGAESETARCGCTGWLIRLHSRWRGKIPCGSVHPAAHSRYAASF